MTRLTQRWALLPALAALAACYNGSEVVELQSMSLDNPEWNLGKSDVGKIATAVDLGDDLIVYSDKGAVVVSGGIVSASDSTVTTWGVPQALPRQVTSTAMCARPVRSPSATFIAGRSVQVMAHRPIREQP